VCTTAIVTYRPEDKLFCRRTSAAQQCFILDKYNGNNSFAPPRCRGEPERAGCARADPAPLADRRKTPKCNYGRRKGWQRRRGASKASIIAPTLPVLQRPRRTPEPKSKTDTRRHQQLSFRVPTLTACQGRIPLLKQQIPPIHSIASLHEHRVQLRSDFIDSAARSELLLMVAPTLSSTHLREPVSLRAPHSVWRLRNALKAAGDESDLRWTVRWARQ